MTYPEGFFSHMRFPVHELPADTDLFKQFPILENYDSFKVAFLTFEETTIEHDRNTILRYIFYCYDESIQWDVPDFETRKTRAAKLAGIKTDMIKMLVANKLYEVNNMILDFLKIQNNRTFTWKVLALGLIEEYSKLILMPISPGIDDDKKLKAANTKTKMLMDCRDIGKEVDTLDELQFGSIEEANEISVLVPITKRTSPEARAKLK